MSIDGIGKNKVNLTQIKAGLEFKTIQGNTKNESIFKAFDKDGNGVLDEKEVNNLKQSVDKDNDGIATKKEAGKLVKENGLKKQKVKDKDLINFLKQYDTNTENVKESAILENGSVEITYNDGTSKIINPDKSYETVSNNETEKTTNSYTQDDVLTKSKVETETMTTETTYASDGKTLQKQTIQNNETKTLTQTEFNSEGQKEKSVITSQEDGSVATILYENDKPKTKELRNGETVSNFVYLEDGTERITSKIENQGNDVLEKKTEYKYNEDGTYIEDITQEGAQTHTVNNYNAQGHRLDQTKTVGDTEYKATYDGEGNTTGIVVQNKEDIQKIAEKFGCSVEQLQELNGKETFAVGDTIKVPGELEADHAELQNRKTSEEAKIEEQNDKANAAAEAQRRAQVAAKQRQRQAQVAAQREQKQAQAAARRAQEDATLKSLGLIRRTNDKTKLVAKFPGGRKVNLTKVGDANYNRSIYKDKNGKFYVVSHDNKVLKETYVKNTNLYQSGRKVKGRMVDKNGRGVYKTFAEVPGAKKDAHGRRVVVDEKGRAYWMASDNTILKDSYIENSNRADAVRSNTAVARKETMAMLKSQVDSAQAAFDAQMREDGWAGNVADGVSVLWGSKNRAKYVRQELQQFKNDIVELQNCKSDAEFKAKFKQKFGIPYSEKAVADYIMNPNSSNYRKAFGTKRNIGERVAKYNESQQSGATVVKTAAEVGAAVALTAATVATGGAAGVAAAVVVAGSSAFAADLVVETSDRMSSEQGLQEGEMTEILKGAATDGVIAAATMGVSKAGQAAYKVGKAAYVSGKVASSGGKAVVAGEKAVSSSASKALAATTEKAIATSEKAVAKAGSGAAQMVETSVTKAEAAVAKAETAVGKTAQAAASTQSAATNAVDVTLSRTEEAIIDTMADVSVGAGAEYIETGEITAAGTLTNMAVGATGLAGEKLAHSGIVKKVRSSISDSYHRAKDGIGDAFSAASDKFRYSGPDINPSGGAGGAGRPHSGADGASTSNGASQKTSGADSSSGNAHNAGKTDGHTNRADNAHNTNNAEPNRNQRADKSQDTNSTQKTQDSSQEPKPMSEQEIKQAMDELEPKLKEAQIAKEIETEFADVLNGEITDPAVLAKKAKQMMMKAHPDKGGSQELSIAINNLKDAKTPAQINQALSELKMALRERSSKLSSYEGKMKDLHNKAEAHAKAKAEAEAKAKAEAEAKAKAEAEAKAKAEAEAKAKAEAEAKAKAESAGPKTTHTTGNSRIDAIDRLIARNEAATNLTSAQKKRLNKELNKLRKLEEFSEISDNLHGVFEDIDAIKENIEISKALISLMQNPIDVEAWGVLAGKPINEKLDNFLEKYNIKAQKFTKDPLEKRILKHNFYILKQDLGDIVDDVMDKLEDNVNEVLHRHGYHIDGKTPDEPEILRFQPGDEIDLEADDIKHMFNEESVEDEVLHHVDEDPEDLSYDVDDEIYDSPEPDDYNDVYDDGFYGF